MLTAWNESSAGAVFVSCGVRLTPPRDAIDLTHSHGGGRRGNLAWPVVSCKPDVRWSCRLLPPSIKPAGIPAWRSEGRRASTMCRLSAAGPACLLAAAVVLVMMGECSSRCSSRRARRARWLLPPSPSAKPAAAPSPLSWDVGSRGARTRTSSRLRRRLPRRSRCRSCRRRRRR